MPKNNSAVTDLLDAGGKDADLDLDAEDTDDDEEVTDVDAGDDADADNLADADNRDDDEIMAAFVDKMRELGFPEDQIAAAEQAVEDEDPIALIEICTAALKQSGDDLTTSAPDDGLMAGVPMTAANGVRMSHSISRLTRKPWRPTSRRAILLSLLGDAHVLARRVNRQRGGGRYRMSRGGTPQPAIDQEVLARLTRGAAGKHAQPAQRLQQSRHDDVTRLSHAPKTPTRDEQRALSRLTGGKLYPGAYHS